LEDEKSLEGRDQLPDGTEFHQLTNQDMTPVTLGLCEPGEGGGLAASGDTALGGRIPLNVSGGLLSPGRKTPGHPIRSHKNVTTLRRLQ